jgi:hypothetical protein
MEVWGMITIENIIDIETDLLRSEVFKLIEVHVDYISLDQEKFTYLLGYYPAMYNYVSELYTFMIGQVRAFVEVKDQFRTANSRDKRDILEQALKSIKLQYESLSRKITLLAPNLARGDI